MIFLKITQVILSLLVIFLILIQSKSQGLGAGLAGAFTMYRSTRGTLSNTMSSFENIAANKIFMAEFLAPDTSTDPRNGFLPSRYIDIK